MSIPAWKADVNRWVRNHYGVITAVKLRELHCPPSSARRMIQRGELIPIAVGVYRSAHVKPGQLQQMSAVCQLIPSATIGFTTAGRLHEIRKMPHGRIHVLVPHPTSPTIPGVQFHRCRNIEPSDRIERADGIRVTSASRTVFDSADMIGYKRCVSAVEHVLAAKLCTLSDLSQILLRLWHPRRPGSRTFRAVLGSREPWRTAVDTDLELVVLTAINELNLPDPVVQMPMRLPNGKPIRVDFAWPAAKVILEVDHSWWHDGSEPIRLDKERDRQLAMIGWMSLRITDSDVKDGRLPIILAEIATIIASRTLAA